MPQLIDCYWLLNTRDSKTLESSLNQIIPKRQPSAVDYPIPQYSESPKKILNDIDRIMDFLEKHQTEPYSIYWKNLDEGSIFRHIMLFYTNDGGVILGLSIAGEQPDDKDIINRYLDIKESLNSPLGCITIEEPPPLNSIEFKEFYKKRLSP